VSTIFDLASCILYRQSNVANPQSIYSQAVCLKMPLRIMSAPPTFECPWSVNNFGEGSASYTAMKCISLVLNGIVYCQSSQSVLVYNFRNKHAMSYRSDFFACSSRANI